MGWRPLGHGRNDAAADACGRPIRRLGARPLDGRAAGHRAQSRLARRVLRRHPHLERVAGRLLRSRGRELRGVGRSALDLSGPAAYEGRGSRRSRRRERACRNGVLRGAPALPAALLRRTDRRGRRYRFGAPSPRIAAGRVAPGQADRAVPRQLYLPARQALDRPVGDPPFRCRARRLGQDLGDPRARRPSGAVRRRRGRRQHPAAPERPPPPRSRKAGTT